MSEESDNQQIHKNIEESKKMETDSSVEILDPEKDDGPSTVSQKVAVLQLSPEPESDEDIIPASPDASRPFPDSPTSKDESLCSTKKAFRTPLSLSKSLRKKRKNEESKDTDCTKLGDVPTTSDSNAGSSKTSGLENIRDVSKTPVDADEQSEDINVSGNTESLDISKESMDVSNESVDLGKDSLANLDTESLKDDDGFSEGFDLRYSPSQDSSFLESEIEVLDEKKSAQRQEASVKTEVRSNSDTEIDEESLPFITLRSSIKETPDGRTSAETTSSDIGETSQSLTEDSKVQEENPCMETPDVDHESVEVGHFHLAIPEVSDIDLNDNSKQNKESIFSKAWQESKLVKGPKEATFTSSNGPLSSNISSSSSNNTPSKLIFSDSNIHDSMSQLGIMAGDSDEENEDNKQNEDGDTSGKNKHEGKKEETKHAAEKKEDAAEETEDAVEEMEHAVEEKKHVAEENNTATKEATSSTASKLIVREGESHSTPNEEGLKNTPVSADVSCSTIDPSPLEAVPTPASNGTPMDTSTTDTIDINDGMDVDEDSRKRKDGFSIPLPLGGSPDKYFYVYLVENDGMEFMEPPLKVKYIQVVDVVQDRPNKLFEYPEKGLVFPNPKHSTSVSSGFLADVSSQSLTRRLSRLSTVSSIPDTELRVGDISRNDRSLTSAKDTDEGAKQDGDVAERSSKQATITRKRVRTRKKEELGMIPESAGEHVETPKSSSKKRKKRGKKDEATSDSDFAEPRPVRKKTIKRIMADFEDPNEGSEFERKDVPEEMEIAEPELEGNASDGLSFKVGQYVFALWRDCMYYPGKVVSVIPTSFEWPDAEILFDDGVRYKSSFADMFPISAITEGTSCYGKEPTSNEVEPGIVIGFKNERNKVLYEVEMDSGLVLTLSREMLSMTRDQARAQGLEKEVVSDSTFSSPIASGVYLDNIVSGKRRRVATNTSSLAPKGKKRGKKDPVLDSTSVTESEQEPGPSTPRIKEIKDSEALLTPKQFSAKPARAASSTRKARSSSKSEPSPASKATPKSTAKATPKSTAKSTPKSTAKATPKSTAKATPKSTAKATPRSKSKAKESPKTTPKASTSRQSGSPVVKSLEKVSCKASSNKEEIKQRRKGGKRLHRSDSDTPSSAKRSAKRARKVSEEFDLPVESNLGPIPSEGSSLFQSLGFVFTGSHLLEEKPDGNNDDLSAIEGDPNEVSSYDREHLIKQVKCGGGEVYDSVNELMAKCDAGKSYLISPKHCRTQSYMEALASGIPPLRHNWIIESCYDNKCASIADHLLDRGYSRVSGTLIPFNLARQERLFSGLKVMLMARKGSKFFKAMTMWCLVLKSGNAETTTKFPANNPKPGAGPLPIYDVIVTDSQCPKKLIEDSVDMKIPLVSSEWIVQCLIEGRRLPYDGHEFFKWDYVPSQ